MQNSFMSFSSGRVHPFTEELRKEYAKEKRHGNDAIAFIIIASPIGNERTIDPFAALHSFQSREGACTQLGKQQDTLDL